MSEHFICGLCENCHACGIGEPNCPGEEPQAPPLPAGDRASSSLGDDLLRVIAEDGGESSQLTTEGMARELLNSRARITALEAANTVLAQERDTITMRVKQLEVPLECPECGEQVVPATYIVDRCHKHLDQIAALAEERDAAIAELATLEKLAGELSSRMHICAMRINDDDLCGGLATCEYRGSTGVHLYFCDKHRSRSTGDLPWAKEMRALVALLASDSAAGEPRQGAAESAALSGIEKHARILVDHLLDSQTYPAHYDGPLRAHVLALREQLDAASKGAR